MNWFRSAAQPPAAILLALGLLTSPTAAQQPAPAEAKQPAAAGVAKFITGLSSDKFLERQEAHEALVKAGLASVEALEKEAGMGEAEAAARCVAILADLAGKPDSEKQATAALERLAKNDRPVADQAARALAKMRTTDADRAVAQLAAQGVHIYRGSDGSVRSVNARNDEHLALAKHLPKLRYLRVYGADVTDKGIEQILGAKYLTSLTLSRTSITDAGLGKLKALPSLDRLTLSLDGGVTNQGLQQLQHLPKLRSLMLRSSDDADLSFLPAMKQISYVSLSLPRLRDEDIKAVNALQGLRRCMIFMKEATDDQLRQAAQIKQPLSLHLSRSPDLTDAGWKHLTTAQLANLSLSSMEITDKTLVKIGELRTLESLTIFGSPITDKGLEHLHQLKSLRTVSLHQTNTTKAGLEKLKKALPRLRAMGGLLPVPAPPAPAAPPAAK